MTTDIIIAFLLVFSVIMTVLRVVEYVGMAGCYLARHRDTECAVLFEKAWRRHSFIKDIVLISWWIAYFLVTGNGGLK